MNVLARPKASITVPLVFLVAVAMCASLSFFAPRSPAATDFNWRAEESQMAKPINGITGAGADDVWAVSDFAQLSHTGSLGGTWSKQVVPGGTTDLNAVSAADSDNAWAVGASEWILHTEDGGKTEWKQQAYSLAGYDLHGVCATSASVAWAVGSKEAIMRTGNGGRNWNAQHSGPSGSTLRGVSAASTSAAWAVGDEGLILHTDNGGKGWSEQTSGTTRDLMDVAAVDSENAWAVGSNGTIRRTSDGGGSWVAQNSNTTRHLYGISSVDEDHAFAVGEEGTILYTQDGGSTWTAQESGVENDLNCVTAVDIGAIWVGGSEGMVLHGSASRIAGCEPATVVQGHSYNVDVTGSHTHFEEGLSAASLSGAGITVNSTYVSDANHACATIDVDVDAPAGYRNLNVETGGEVPAALQNVFLVKEGPASPPRMDSLEPVSGEVGVYVTVRGSSFGDSKGDSYVSFNGVQSNAYVSWSTQKVVCQVPYQATSGPVTVTTPAGTSNGIQFTVEQPHTPVIFDAFPNSVHQGDSNVSIHVTGQHTHFKQGASEVIFSGPGIYVRSTDVIDSTHAVARVDVAADAAIGPRNVNVVTGSETPRPLAGHFTVHQQGTTPPQLYWLSPTSGDVGTRVSLHGSNFGELQGSSYVKFSDKVLVTNYESWSNDKVVCHVPAGAVSGAVTVTTGGGTSGGERFVVGIPRIKDCDPKTVYQGHEVELHVVGYHTDFEDKVSEATVSGQGATVNSTFVSDANHATAHVKVAKNAPATTRELNVVTGSETPEPLKGVFTVMEKPSNPPLIHSLHPDGGQAGTIVVIVGERFGISRGSSSVSFAGAQVTNYIYWTDHEIICSVPLESNSGPVVVHTPWGNSPGRNFTVEQPAFYFAEGTCRPGFDPYLTIQNPTDQDADIAITYMTGDGKTREEVVYVAKHSRSTVPVKGSLGEGDDAAHDFSAKVASTNDVNIIAERPMYFNYNGVWSGGHDVIGTLSPAETFYFAEGTSRTGFEPYFTVQNPNYAQADVSITYMKGDGTNEEQSIEVEPTSRSTVTVNDFLGTGDDLAHDFSARVESDDEKGIIVERPMYFSYGQDKGVSWTGGHDVVGAMYPMETFYFAEGTCRPNFDPYLTVQNPSGADADIVITYMRGDGTTTQQDLTVSARARSTVTVKDFLGEGDSAAYDFSCRVESMNNVDVIVERPMYFNYNDARTGGSDVVGALSGARDFYFAEGTTRSGFDPYLTIQNPGLADARVEITYMKGDGTTEEQEVTVPAHSRYTVAAADFLGTGDDPSHDFSTRVRCINYKEIIVERPMYFNYNGAWTGGSDVVGFAP